MKFVFAYHGGGSGLPEDEAEMAEIMAAWGAWMEKEGAAFLDGGNPISENRTVNSDGSVSADGGSNPLTGYGIIDAPDYDEAIRIAQGCPVLTSGGSVEVCAAIDM